MNYLLRRRKLGKTSCDAIVAKSTSGILTFRNDAPTPHGNFVFRWGCTSTVDSEVIVNEAEAIHRVSDKRRFRAILDKENLCPKTWTKPEEADYPCIVRPPFHHQGRDLYVCQDIAEVKAALKRCPGGYINRFIDKVAEFRVFVVSGKVVCVARKYPNKDAGVAWNVAQGGRFENVRWSLWPIKAIKASLKAFELSKLDFGGVDVMVDANEDPYVLEINSAPSLTCGYRQACFAKAFDYIVKNGKEHIANNPARKSYGRFIHPAIDRE